MLARIIHVGRNEVAQVVAGTAQTQSLGFCTLRAVERNRATEVPARSAFARSGLRVGELSGLTNEHYKNSHSLPHGSLLTAARTSAAIRKAPSPRYSGERVGVSDGLQFRQETIPKTFLNSLVEVGERNREFGPTPLTELKISILRALAVSFATQVASP